MASARRTPALTRVNPPAPSAHSRPEPAGNAQQALALDVPPARVRPHSAAPVRRLWFCVYLPRLPLEATGPGSEARVVVEEQQGIHRVLLACAAARAAGIQQGQSSNAALALLPTLQIEERCTLREQRALEALAGWLEQFSSVVCIAGPDVLLVEIAGSLRLYGGLVSLRDRISQGLETLGYSALLAIAPTPLAATWLARAEQHVCIQDPANLATALRHIPLGCLDWPAATVAAISGLGVTTVGDCQRLPREGFARRFGPQRLLDLDRAMGRLPDPRQSWRAPETFCVDHEMTEEQHDREILLRICQELLTSLERFLLTRQLGTQRIQFSFFHLRAAATRVVVGCARPERLAAHWFDLLRIRFERVQLAEPVIAIRLHGGHNQPLQTESGHLALQKQGAGRDCHYTMAQLAERLAARMGHQAVHGVQTLAEHRPQQAWQPRHLTAGKALPILQVPAHKPARPLWMLPEPTRLAAEQGEPRHFGRLRLLDGPERLETGWWDGAGIARDYYTAINAHGMQLWIFRNRGRAADWYLHGFFG